MKEYYDKLLLIAEQNKALINKTAVYLGPTLNYLNPEIKKAINKVGKAIHLRVYNTAIVHNDNLISLVIKVENPFDFNAHVEELRKVKYYVTDHPFYKAFESNPLHTFVFEFDYPGAIEFLQQGKYSKMYGQGDLTRIFKVKPDDSPSVAREKKRVINVCSKDETYRKSFEQWINTTLCVEEEPDTWINITEEDELDGAFINKEELYNYEPNTENTGVE